MNNTGQPRRESYLVACDIHPGMLTWPGVGCPMCQRTDSTTLAILRDLRQIKDRLAMLEAAQPKEGR